MLTNYISPAFLSGKAPIAFDFPKSSTRQWNYLAHSWDLGLQTSGHTPMGHEYRASGGLDSSEILWFCLGRQGTQLPSTTSRRFPSLGHIGLTVWEAIIDAEGLRTRIPFHSKLLSNGEAESESDKHRHTHTHCTYHSHLVDTRVDFDLINSSYSLIRSWKQFAKMRMRT